MDFLVFVLLVAIPVCIIVPIVLKKQNKSEALVHKPSLKAEAQPALCVPDVKLVDFAKTQLIGGSRFTEAYDAELKLLHSNTAFMDEIKQLRNKYNGCEISETQRVNKDIADYFYYNNLNEKYAQVNSITQRVKMYGKQASAHISIYYAMFLYD